MTIMEAITRLDDLKSNTYSREEKVKWLSLADSHVAGQILSGYGTEVSFPGYREDTPADTVLLVPEPFDDLYLHWLSAQMDLYNGEYTRFNNAMALFTARFRDYDNDYRRCHMPAGQKLKFR